MNLPESEKNKRMDQRNKPKYSCEEKVTPAQYKQELFNNLSVVFLSEFAKGKG